MNQALNRRLEVHLMVDHPTLSSSQLQGLLKAVADESWNVGETYKPSPASPQQHYLFSRWAIREVATCLNDLPTALRVITQRLQPIKGNFSSLPADASVYLTLLVSETDSVIGLGLSAEVIELLALLRAGIEISFVVRTN